MRVVVIDPWLSGAGLAMLMDLAMLCVTGRILRQKRHWPRLVSASFVGGLYQLWLGIRWELGSVFGWEWGLFLAVGIAMVIGSYPPRNPGQFLRSIFLFYLLTFLTVGVSMGVMAMAALAGGRSIQTWQFMLLNIASLLIVSELGWGMVHDAIWTRTHLAEIKVELDGKTLHLKAFLDTGNQLRDPVTRLPVVLLSLPAVYEKLPSAVGSIVQKLMEGEMPETSSDSSWLRRFRYLPFTGVGNARGLLVGLTVDSLMLIKPVQKRIQPAVLGFTVQKFPSGDYHAVFPVVLIEEMSPVSS